ncbi:MAG: hypothetical protein IMZ75_06080, partial [Actinobacteria bacterium]|nr:hypothetical protein [Actinomycetota bacterium]
MTTSPKRVEGAVPGRPWLANYEPVVPHEVDVPSQTLYELLRHSAERFPDHVAIAFLG